MASVIQYLSLRVPPDIKRQLDEQAHRDHTSLNKTAIAILRAWFTPGGQESDHEHAQ